MSKKGLFSKHPLASLAILALLTSCGGAAASSQGANASFSYFIATSDTRVGYYTDETKNPVINWLLTANTWGENKAKVNLEFEIPPTGTAGDIANLMFTSGDYYDVVDLSGYSGNVLDLYDQGIVLDLTDYIAKYMPNYSKWMDSHPAEKKQCMDNVDGEMKYLRLYDATDVPAPWGGFCYRRDWLAKYGTNPTTKAAFTGGYDANHKWSDDVVFPSGNTDPTTLSDWDWMLPIFKKALSGEGISDGYCMQVPYYGFYGTSDIVGSFGTSPYFYMDSDLKDIHFGGNSDNFRAYISMMNKWYENGFIDKGFAERNNEMFYTIDTTSVFSGKVGMWYGLTGQMGNNLDISEGKDNNQTNGYTKDICVYGAAQPINDKFGTAAMQGFDPFVFYSMARNSVSAVVTNKAKDKDISALLSMLDYLYTDDGAMMGEAGLSKKEYEDTKDEVYTKFGLTDGAWYNCDENGTLWDDASSKGNKMWRMNPIAEKDDALRGVIKRNRVVGRSWGTYNNAYTGSLEPAITRGLSNWSKYSSTSLTLGAVQNKETLEEGLESSKISVKIQDFIQKTVPTFIIGTKDVDNDATWNSYCSALAKYNPDRVVEILKATYAREFN